jgi:hypothetical protein
VFINYSKKSSFGRKGCYERRTYGEVNEEVIIMRLWDESIFPRIIGYGGKKSAYIYQKKPVFLSSFS